MEKDFIVLNNAEACIYNELRKARQAWYDVEKLYNDKPNVATLEIVNQCAKTYIEYRAFVSRAFGVDMLTIENILDGKYKVLCEESID